MTSHKLYPIYFYATLSPAKIGLVPPFSSWKGRGTDKPQFNLFWQLLEISHRERSPCLSVRNDIQPHGPRQKETLLFCKSIQACIDILAEVPAHPHLNGEKRETSTLKKRKRNKNCEARTDTVALKAWNKLCTGEESGEKTLGWLVQQITTLLRSVFQKYENNSVITDKGYAKIDLEMWIEGKCVLELG